MNTENIDFSTFDIESLDLYEKAVYTDLLIRGYDKNSAINFIIANVENDIFQLSDSLREYIENHQ